MAPGPSDSAMAAPRPPSPTGSQRRDGGTHGVIGGSRSCGLYSSISTLLFDKKFSDMTITCRGRTFKAHRAIVCTQSSFFDKALSSGFKETISEVVDLPDDDPAMLDCFLQFLYTGTYNDGEYANLGNPSGPAMMTCQEVGEELAVPPGVVIGGVHGKLPIGPQAKHLDRNNKAGINGHAATRNGAGKAAFDDDDDPNDADFPGQGSSVADHEHEPWEEYDESDEGSDVNEVRDIRDGWDGGRPLGAAKWPARSLFLPLRLYVMADKYDVAALKLLTRDRLYRTIEACWITCEDFPAFVDELYRCTPPNDLTLRGIVSRGVGNRLEEDMTRWRLEGVMRKHGDLAVDVMNYYLQSKTERWRD